MEEHSSVDAFLPPAHTNTFGIPNKIDIMDVYNVYRASKETRKLLSERGRSLFAEVFIEDTNLGTLSDLSVRALARGFGAKEITTLVSSDPLKLRVHFDSLSVDLPLEECYFISDQLFWRRVVLAKHHDPLIALKKMSLPWKNMGISLKLVELVENCAAEYWPEEQMKTLAPKICEYVTEMHIRKLMPMQERSFEEYIESESSSAAESEEEESSEISSSESDNEGEENEMAGEEAEEEEEGEEEDNAGADMRISGDESRKSAAAKKALIKAREAAERAARRQQLREEKRARRLAKIERRRKREEKRAAALQALQPAVTKKKKKITGVFDIVVSEDEDEDANIMDKRNIEKFAKRLKTYKYPPEHCHHIDLRFVGDFIYLTSFSIEFQPPEQKLDYHPRIYNFSYVDTQRLADGLTHCLKLKIFRLTNSRMDARKLDILLRALRMLPEIEELDFTNDQLQDNCGQSFYDFFIHNTSLKRLELRTNDLDTNVLEKLAFSLEVFEGQLEYLGLAGNWLGYSGLHSLVNTLIGSQHVSSLCLRGAKITQEAFICCIANELVRQHRPLIELDLTAIELGETAGVELIKALDTNNRILRLPCQACDLPLDIIVDIRLVLSRNQYLLDNPYIGDETQTEEDIADFVNRLKEPLLLEAFERVRKKRECIEARPDQFRRSTLQAEEAPEEEVPEVESDIWDLYKLLGKDKPEETVEKEPSVKSVPSAGLPFVYDPNNFTLQQILEQVYVPGPGNRYAYFRGIYRRAYVDSAQEEES